MSNIPLNILRTALSQNIEGVLKHFVVEYQDKINRLTGKCPCHNGDNPTSLSIQLEGYPGQWRCYTKSCHEDYGSDMIGLVWGILSNRSIKTVSFPEVLNYCEKIVDTSNVEVVEYGDFDKISVVLQRKALDNKTIGNKTSLNGLKIPSDYFIKRGFSERILEEFHIGDCWNPQKPMFGRAVCPIFDVGGDSIIGCAGRVIEEKEYLQKWKYNFGFKAGSTFYGLWKARSTILRKSSVILVEGQMDVVRLHELGYTETLGCFGCHLTDGQLDILNQLGVMNVTILMDGDDAGKQAAERIQEKCKLYFNTKVVTLSDNQDPDNLTKEELEQLL